VCSFAQPSVTDVHIYSLAQFSQRLTGSSLKARGEVLAPYVQEVETVLYIFESLYVLIADRKIDDSEFNSSKHLSKFMCFFGVL
jgi:hypothetical protein